MAEHEMKRIVVIGTCGSGETTLAGNTAKRIGGPHVELDANVVILNSPKEMH